MGIRHTIGLTVGLAAASSVVAAQDGRVSVSEALKAFDAGKYVVCVDLDTVRQQGGYDVVLPITFHKNAPRAAEGRKELEKVLPRADRIFCAAHENEMMARIQFGLAFGPK